MPKRQQLTIEQRAAICTLSDDGYSMRTVAKKLRVSLKGVHYTLKRRNETGLLIVRKRRGRPRVTTTAEDRYIVAMSKRNRRLTAVEIADQVSTNRVTRISVTTVKDRLKAAGLRGCVAVKKPFLKPIHRQKRLAWAREHENWSIDDWKNVLWTDESKFVLFGGNRRVFGRRRPDERLKEECIVPSIKHGGGNVMVWGCFGGFAVGDLVKIEGTMRKEDYLKILREHAIPSGHRIIGPTFVLEQDNDPKHTAKIYKELLEEKEASGDLVRMVWPPQSPDLSPIEYLWDELDRKAKQRLPQNSKQLWLHLQEAWQQISPDYFEK